MEAKPLWVYSLVWRGQMGRPATKEMILTQGEVETCLRCGSIHLADGEVQIYMLAQQKELFMLWLRQRTCNYKSFKFLKSVPGVWPLPFFDCQSATAETVETEENSGELRSVFLFSSKCKLCHCRPPQAPEGEDPGDRQHRRAGQNL